MVQDLTMDTTQLLETLQLFEQVHVAREQAYADVQTIEAEYDEVYAAFMTVVADEVNDQGKLVYSNQQRRESEVSSRINQFDSTLINRRQEARKHYEQYRNSLERVEKRLNTLRDIANFVASENNLLATKINAELMLAQSEHDKKLDTLLFS